MMNPNVLLSEELQFVIGLAPIVPSSSTPQYVKLSKYNKLTVIIMTANLAAGATGTAVTLLQATNVGAGGEKALAFTTARRNLDPTVNDTLVDFTVASNTFTTDSTASKNPYYEITVDESTVDTANNFCCVRAGTANATNTTVAVLYMLWPAKYGKHTPPSAIVN